MIFTKKQPIPTIAQNIAETSQVRDYVSKLACPKCTEKHLKLTAYTQGKQGFEAQLICEKCHATGIINNTGINMNFSGVPTQ